MADRQLLLVALLLRLALNRPQPVQQPFQVVQMLAQLLRIGGRLEAGLQRLLQLLQ
jgi:hypothetical protein